VPREQARVFGEAAELYERRRPGYPEALYDALMAAVDDPRRVLEAGAGTGRASVALAERGLQVDAVEPDPAMAAIARRLTAGLPVRVHEARFESWDPEPAAFDLVACAQAWHWIDDARGAEVAARALRDGGALGVWWNRPRALGSEVFHAVQDAYRREAPSLAEAMALLATGSLESPAPQPLPRFGAWEYSAFDWTAVYDGLAYSELIQTQSDHRMLPADELRRLVTAVRQAIEETGPLEYPYRAHLWIALLGSSS
jgi:SAM-dependent methyltransferase